MALQIKSLAVGSIIASGYSTLYSPPTGKMAIISSVILTNYYLPTFSGYFYVDNGTTSGRVTLDKSLISNDRLTLTDRITLQTGESLKWMSTSWPSLSNAKFMVSGMERDV